MSETKLLSSLASPFRADGSRKIAPVQGYSPGIPWEMHIRAYDAYCKKYGEQRALIDIEGRGCRGGFGTGELDMFIPGWREELSERKAMRDRIKALEAALRKAAIVIRAHSPDPTEPLEEIEILLGESTI